jgi:nicotine blue oxidoreductase
VIRTAGLVLAAGEGRRFGGPKAPYVLDGERLVDRAVRVLREGGCDPVLVVLGAWVGSVPDAEVVENPEWVSGMGSSLRVGLAALADRDEVERALVSLVDLPGLTGVAVARLLTSGHRLASASYAGERGHPVLLGREHWEAVAESARGDRGARAYLALHDVPLVEVGDVASGEDLDEVAPAT